MKILVTGGAGYIGSIATECIFNAGHDAIVFDNLYMGHREAIHPEAAFIEGALNDRKLLSECFHEHQPEAGIRFPAGIEHGAPGDVQEEWMLEIKTEGVSIVEWRYCPEGHRSGQNDASARVPEFRHDPVQGFG